MSVISVCQILFNSTSILFCLTSDVSSELIIFLIKLKPFEFSNKKFLVIYLTSFSFIIFVLFNVNEVENKRAGNFMWNVVK
nr:hypothetical protein 5 - Neurospora crassa mitochondrion plasmid maranhar [Neurospora crassa]